MYFGSFVTPQEATYCSFKYYNSTYSLEMTSKVENIGKKKEHNFIFLAQLSQNGMHRVVGYQRQRIHAVFKNLSNEDIGKLTLDSDWI